MRQGPHRAGLGIAGDQKVNLTPFFAGGYVALVLCVSPLSVPRVIERDPDDDHVIACAIAAQADAIVSGDRDLTELGSWQGISIISAREALVMIP